MFRPDDAAERVGVRNLFIASLLIGVVKSNSLPNPNQQNVPSSSVYSNNASIEVETKVRATSDIMHDSEVEFLHQLNSFFVDDNYDVDKENSLSYLSNWTRVNVDEVTEERWKPKHTSVLDVQHITKSEKMAALEIQKKMKTFFTSRYGNITALQLLLAEYNNESEKKSKATGRLWESIVSRRMYNLWTRFDTAANIDTVIEEVESSVMTSVSCNACEAAAGFLQESVARGNTKEDIVQAGLEICRQFEFNPLRVCLGVVTNLAAEVTSVAQTVLFTPAVICSFLVGSGCRGGVDQRLDWRVQLPPYPKPPLRGQPPTEGAPTFKVLHLSDTHFDPYYLEGSNADCGEPLCCREGDPATEEARAGRWGDYRKCDTPLRTIHNMFENILSKHKDINYILWTGDLPPHDIWNQTRDSNLLVLRQTVQQLFDHFPNTRVFPALGNHESAPVNSYPPPSVSPEHSVQWLYNEVDQQWRRWLPEDTSPTILKGGFYSAQVVPGLRIISINTNYCNHKNLMLILDSEDPANQLQWLVYQLQAAELNNERVHIIGHIPPGYQDCLRVWSRNFNTIVNRYESTISAQFYGHTHYDEFKIFYERDAANVSRATNVAYVAPSVTTYGGLNPGYRIYHVEAAPGSHHRVVDHETWIMNLAEANHPSAAHLAPRWQHLYSARAAYGMQALLPADWNRLVYRMVEDEDLFQMFYRHFLKNASAPKACVVECKKLLLCDLMSGRSHDHVATCSLLHESVEALRPTVWSNWFFPGLIVTSLGSVFMML